jgi:hypothetical protein
MTHVWLLYMKPPNTPTQMRGIFTTLRNAQDYADRLGAGRKGQWVDEGGGTAWRMHETDEWTWQINREPVDEGF